MDCWLQDDALHLFGLLRVDLDGVDSVLMDASLEEVCTVTELLLFIRNLCAIGHDCGNKINIKTLFELCSIKTNKTQAD